MVMGTARGVAPDDHSVCFYDHDSHLVADLARFVLDGLVAGERVIVVATADHRAALDDALAQAGTDSVRACCSGRYIAMDASETLDRFTVNGMPDSDAFMQTVGRVLEEASADGSPLRVFGEMVALLWTYGNVVGAIELERLWNQVALTRQFRLLCGYPASTLMGGSLDATRRVCAMHCDVFAPASYSTVDADDHPAASPAVTSAVFLPVPTAVPSARRFVAGILIGWGRDDLVGDASLIVTELATNAVQHATSPFRVAVERGTAGVRIAIEDLGPIRPRLRDAAWEDSGGRGLAIIAHLARRWGYDILPTGKVIWAELAARP
jgi:hypothetical protein